MVKVSKQLGSLDISKWIEFDITQEDIRKAKLRRQLIDNAVPLEYQQFNSEYRWIGHLGEDKFEEVVKKTTYETDKPIGHKDILDFKINNKTIDIKTNKINIHPANTSHNYKFLILKAQFDSKRIDYYVAITLFLEIMKGWFCGWIPYNEVIIYPTINHGYGLSYAIPFSDLHPMINN